jgi:hypothetical protein
MARRALQTFLTILAIGFACGTMVSHWHPFHWSKISDQGQGMLRLDFGHGGLHLFLQSHRGSCLSPATSTTKEFLLGGFGVRQYSDLSEVRLPGMHVEWCWQSAGYRHVRLFLRFFTLAILAAAYPTFSVVSSRARQFVRARKGLCLKCGYDMRGSDSRVCSECGWASVPSGGR